MALTVKCQNNYEFFNNFQPNISDFQNIRCWDDFNNISQSYKLKSPDYKPSSITIIFKQFPLLNLYAISDFLINYETKNGVNIITDRSNLLGSDEKKKYIQIYGEIPSEYVITNVIGYKLTFEKNAYLCGLTFGLKSIKNLSVTYLHFVPDNFLQVIESHNKQKDSYKLSILKKNLQPFGTNLQLRALKGATNTINNYLVGLDFIVF